MTPMPERSLYSLVWVSIRPSFSGQLCWSRWWCFCWIPMPSWAGYCWGWVSSFWATSSGMLWVCPTARRDNASWSLYFCFSSTWSFGCYLNRREVQSPCLRIKTSTGWCWEQRFRRLNLGHSMAFLSFCWPLSSPGCGCGWASVKWSQAHPWNFYWVYSKLRSVLDWSSGARVHLLPMASCRWFFWWWCTSSTLRANWVSRRSAFPWSANFPRPRWWVLWWGPGICPFR